MLELRHRAMACDFVVLMHEGGSRADAALDALESIDEMESRWSVYDTHSEISKINRLGFQSDVAVSRDTFDLLVRAVELSRQTEGAFDVTAGPLVDVWGFTGRSGRKPTRDQLADAMACVGPDAFQLDATTRTVRLSRPGVKLNLGAIGKGQAIDHLAQRLTEAGVDDFLIHAGHSSVLARGNQFTLERNKVERNKVERNKGELGDGDSSESPRGWMVGIAHPTKPRRRLAGVWLRDSALATSGSGKQFFHHRGQRYGHVIDPRTGQPAGDWLSLTIQMPRAVDADATATGWFVMGQEAANAAADANQTPLLSVSPTSRQDDVSVEFRGQWHWADAPAATANDDSRPG